MLIKNILNYQPIIVDIIQYYDTHQIDIDGTGVLRYNEDINEDLLAEIHSTIDKLIKNYFNDKDIDSTTVGYHFNIKPLNRIEPTTNTQVVELRASFYLKNNDDFDNYTTTTIIQSVCFIITSTIFKLNKCLV